MSRTQIVTNDGEALRIQLRDDRAFISVGKDGDASYKGLIQLYGPIEVYIDNGQQIYPAPIPMMPKLTAEEEKMIKSEMMRPGIIEWLPKQNSITTEQREAFCARLYNWACSTNRFTNVAKLVDELLLTVGINPELTEREKLACKLCVCGKRTALACLDNCPVHSRPETNK